MFVATARTSDNKIVGIGIKESLQTYPPFLQLYDVEITQSEFNMISSAGTHWQAFPNEPRWQWNASSGQVEEAPDPRPLLTFSPSSVSLAVGDTAATVAVTADDSGLTEELDLGSARLDFANGEASLLVTTTIPKQLSFSEGTYYRTTTPLSISVVQPVGQV